MKKKNLLRLLPLAVVAVVGFGSSFMLQPNKDKGIGPVSNVELGPLNKKMTDDGKAIFVSKCIVCHDLDQKKIGPPLRNITTIRTPEYIMNLLLNTAQMQKEDVYVKQLIKNYNNLPMTPPGLNQAQARSVVEYLRSVLK
jgi:mono/diheme cytochrome c family protein